MRKSRQFSDEQIVATALELLDGGGADAVSIRSVATRLGVNPNAVYTYVASRADLERLVAEHILGAVAFPGAAASWADRIVRFAADLRAELLRHPAVAQLLMRAPMDGAAARAVGEWLMAALAEGMDAEDAARTTYLVIVHVLGSVALEAAETAGVPPLPPESERIAQRRGALADVDAQRWPRTAAARDVMADWISGAQFEWGLRRILGVQR